MQMCIYPSQYVHVVMDVCSLYLLCLIFPRCSSVNILHIFHFGCVFNLTCMRFAVQSVCRLVGCVLHIIYNVHMTGPFFCYSPILFTPVLVGWSLGGKS